MRKIPALPLLAIPLLAATGLSPSRAHAQGTDRVAAEALFAEGRALLKSGRVAEACAKLQASQKLDPAPGTLLNLGDCYEKAGRTASAWLAFRDAAATYSADKVDRIAHVRGRAAALEPKLCRLRIDVDPSTTMPIVRDGNVVDKSVYGQAVPIDPGTVTVSVREGERVYFMRTVDIAPTAAGCETKSVQIPGIASASATASPGTAAAPAPATPASAGPAPAASAPAPNATQEGERTNFVPLAFAGAGAITIGVGTLLGVSAKSKWEEARGLCVPAGCGTEAQSKAADARTGAGIATVAVGAGAVLLVGGLAWFAFVPKTRTERTALQIVPTVHAGGASFAASGTF